MADQMQTKSLDAPDERRTPEKTRVDLVHLGGVTLGRFTFQPGWRWSECIKPVVGTESCQVHHVGVVTAGRLTVQVAGGQPVTVKAGDAYDIPPGHDAWVEGQEAFSAIEVQGAQQYAQSR